MLATATFSIVRPDQSGDPYETATSTTLATGVAGHLSAVQAASDTAGGHRATYTGTLYLESTADVVRTDRVIDQDGRTWEVLGVLQRVGLGLDYLEVDLRSVDGGADG